MTYFNIIGSDCETIIYKYQHQLNFMEVMKDIEKIKYELVEGCGGVIHGVRYRSKSRIVDYVDFGDNFHGFSAERKRVWKDGTFCFDDYDSYIHIYSNKQIIGNDYLLGCMDEYTRDDGFEDVSHLKNDPNYIEINTGYYILNRSFYIET